MILGSKLLIVLTGYLLNIQSVYGQFVTERLESLAQKTGIKVNDTIMAPAGCDIDSSFFFRGHPLHVKKNQYGEVSHIGYSFFSKEIRKERPLAIYDFLERYLLELDLTESKEQIKEKLRKDNVIYDNKPREPIGDEDVFFNLNILTHHKYEVEWKLGKNYFHLAFDADCQLLLGALEDELEKVMLKKLQRVAQNGSNCADIMLVLDRYGYEKDTLNFCRQSLIDLIEDDCDETSLRNKSEDEEVLFAINHQLGFIHLVNFKPGRARMYAYIPIHNTPDSFIEELIPIYKDIFNNKNLEE